MRVAKNIIFALAASVLLTVSGLAECWKPHTVSWIENVWVTENPRGDTVQVLFVDNAVRYIPNAYSIEKTVTTWTIRGKFEPITYPVFGNVLDIIPQ
jgi:hypothetical protein